MNLKKIMKPENIIPELKADSKSAVIEELLDILVSNNELSDRQKAFDAVWHREKLMSTGLQHGIATPHAKINGISGLTAAVGLKHEGLDFDSMDGEPSKIFVMILSPADARGPHVQFLAEIATLLESEDQRSELLGLNTQEAIHAFFTR